MAIVSLILITWRHTRWHTCWQCNKGFTQSNVCKKHFRIHSWEKPYSCQQCNKGFAQSNVLKQHMRTHNDEKPYPCQQCNKSFAQSGLTDEIAVWFDQFCKLTVFLISPFWNRCKGISFCHFLQNLRWVEFILWTELSNNLLVIFQSGIHLWNCAKVSQFGQFYQTLSYIIGVL